MATNGQQVPALFRRARDEHGKTHWMYKLKYLKRSKPLNFKRLPIELLTNILSRQTGQTCINLSNISYKLYCLLSRILSKMAVFVAIERARQRFTWEKIVGYRWAANCRNSLGNKRTFHGWIEFLLPMLKYEMREKSDRQLVQQLKDACKISRQHDIKWLNLSSLSPKFLGLIINRMSFPSAVRLRQTNHFFRSQVDTALVQFYPASVMFGPLEQEFALFRRMFYKDPTINGSCRGIIGNAHIVYAIAYSAPSETVITEYSYISSRLKCLTSSKEQREAEDRFRMEVEWNRLGYIPPSSNFPMIDNLLDRFGPYFSYYTLK